VEQCQTDNPKYAEFDPELVQNINNMVAIPRGMHQDISAYYGTKQDDLGGIPICQHS